MACRLHWWRAEASDVLTFCGLALRDCATRAHATPGRTENAAAKVAPVGPFGSIGLIPGLVPIVHTVHLTQVTRCTRARRILIVEDDEVLRETIAEALDDDGYVVASTANPLLALEIARCTPPDLAIVDLMLPNLSGEQFCMAIRQTNVLSTLPIIVVSASRTADEVGARVGAVATIRKPFDLYDLMQPSEFHPPAVEHTACTDHIG